MIIVEYRGDVAELYIVTDTHNAEQFSFDTATDALKQARDLAKIRGEKVCRRNLS
jgi:hypothetical protein